VRTSSAESSVGVPAAPFAKLLLLTMIGSVSPSRRDCQRKRAHPRAAALVRARVVVAQEDADELVVAPRTSNTATSG
jgi:hypothetical protein